MKLHFTKRDAAEVYYDMDTIIPDGVYDPCYIRSIKVAPKKNDASVINITVGIGVPPETSAKANNGNVFSGKLCFWNCPVEPDRRRYAFMSAVGVDDSKDDGLDLEALIGMPIGIRLALDPKATQWGQQLKALFRSNTTTKCPITSDMKVTFDTTVAHLFEEPSEEGAEAESAEGAPAATATAAAATATNDEVPF